MLIAFLDTVAPRPYSLNSLGQEALGGTEASVIRIAEELDALVLQHNREVGQGRYQPVETFINPSHVIVLREPAAAIAAVARFPRARVYLWLHDLCGPGTSRGAKLAAHAEALAAQGVTLVAVSRFHLADVMATFEVAKLRLIPRQTFIYNPVVVPDLGTVEVDRNQLVFFSSPHKGLDFALKAFDVLRRRIPDLRLLVGNPGYLSSTVPQVRGVEYLGALPHARILRHVAGSLCTFAPNYIYPETFGLVLAESHAVGTPVLAHPIGAAAEVLGDPAQTIPVPRFRRWADAVSSRAPRCSAMMERFGELIGAYDDYEARIREWRGGNRPASVLNPLFSLDAVARSWRQLLAET